MTLHIFNPEHDIALASNLSNFTAPHAGRQLRNDLGFLPALWAEDGDQILVEHEESAIKAYRRVCHRLEKLGITASHSSRNVQLLCKKRRVFNRGAGTKPLDENWNAWASQSHCCLQWNRQKGSECCRTVGHRHSCCLNCRQRVQLARHSNVRRTMRLRNC